MRWTSGRHAAAVVALAALTFAWMWPVLAGFAEVVPGAGAGDNLTFVWNFWWMRRALSDGDSFFFSPMIFHPAGIDLTLHTHTALAAFVAATLAPAASLLAVNNAVVITHLFLNFVAAYALAFRVTRYVPGALLAAFVFGASPYIGAHLPGHFNLIAAWVLPLTGLFTLIALEGKRRGAWLLGLILAATVYVDYYYAVYAVVLVVTLLARHACELDAVASTPTRARRIASAIFFGAVLFAAGVAAAIARTGGTVLTLGGTRISLRSVTNPLTAMWALIALVAIVRWAPRVRAGVDRSRLRTSVAIAAIAATLMLIAAAPLGVRAARLSQSGDYVSQRYYWRSAPSGIDVATLMLGNPVGRLTRTATTDAYATFNINVVEEVGWLGPGLLILCAVAWARRREHSELARWWLVAGVFGVWALGPRLVVFSRDIGLILPGLALRFIPVVSNARMPGRAMVLVYLALAIVAACGVRTLARSPRGSMRRIAAALAMLVVLDYAPVAPPTYAPGRPSIYDAIAADTTPGAVLELPLGLHDGFGEIGRFDTRTQYFQSFHGRPVFGGYVSRISPAVIERYRTMPVVGALLRLSDGGALGAEDVMRDHAAAVEALRTAGVRFVIVNGAEATPELLAYVRDVLPIDRIGEDAGRIAYVVRSPLP